MSAYRREIFINKAVASEPLKAPNTTRIKSFHASLPNYAPTPVRSLPDLAQELKVKRVFLKDESSRLGLPAFKILGASWGSFRAILSRLDLPISTSIDEVKQALNKQPLRLVAATDGNHGRAVAFMASFLGISSSIFVPSTLDQHVKDAISNQGGSVVEVVGDYDYVVKHACKEAEAEGALLIQDTAWEGYEDIPRWIVQGYSTIFTELEQQVSDLWSEDTAVITPVGVGSLAHAVVQNSKCRQSMPKVVTVEPDTAACLNESLRTGYTTPIATSFTIMTGMDCGTVSHTAFDDLQKYVDASVTVSDYESHLAVQHLAKLDIESGPCGAAGVAALRRLVKTDMLCKNSTVVLLNTESQRSYTAPHDVSTDDPVNLTQILTQIESTNTTLSSTSGSGERAICDYIESWLRHRGIKTHRLAKSPTRPSIVGVVKGSGSGKSLMINGHIDTVSVNGYATDPLGGHLEHRGNEEVVTGRGALDMKASVAIGMCNLARAKSKELKGNVILAAVADEEDASIGTEEILAAGWTADAAIIPEPTKFELAIAHKGFVWIEVTILGKAAHGSDAKTGIDAILNLSYFLDSLREYEKQLPTDPALGKGTLHCGTIDGGEENSSYPASCTVTVEFRTVPGQRPESICSDMKKLLDRIAEQQRDFSYAKPEVTFQRPFYSLSPDHQIVKDFVAAGLATSGRIIKPKSCAFWCDAALLGAKGIPTLIFGPSGEGLHGKDEYVSTSSIREVDKIIDKFVSDHCG